MKSVQTLPNGEVICVLFFLSGFSGLIFEVVWTRILLRSLGVGTTAGACVLAAFMGGLALGAALSSRVPKSVNGLLLFAALELVCGLCGLAIPWLLSATPPAEIQSLPTLAMAFAVLLLPCTAMGASYPTLVRYLRRPNAEPSMILYAVNIAGATIGAITCGFLLLPALGLFRTSAVGSILELVVAAAAAGLAFLPLEASESESPDTQEPASSSPGPMPFWLPPLVAVSSAVAIMLQLCWYRLYFLLLGNSVYSNATVVSTVLFGLAGGTFIAAKIPSSSAEVSRRHLRIALICSAISVAAGMYLLPYLPWLITYASSCLTLGLQSSPLRTIAAVAAVLVPSICLGTIFPLALKSAGQPADQIAGKLYAVNCLGGMIGAGGCGMLLLPYLVSISNTALRDCLVIAIALLYLMSLILTLLAKSRISIKIVSVILSSVPMAAIFIVPPVWDPLVMSQGITFYSYLDLNSIEPGLLLPRASRRAGFYKEGLNSTVTLTDGENTIALRNDGKVEACLAKQKEHVAAQADDTTHTLLGALPLLLHKGPVETVLLIGMGSGTTASAILSFQELKSLVIAELESAVCTAAKKLNVYNGMENSHDTLQQRMDAIGNLRSIDGRILLSSSKDSHDVIVCQAGDPWVAGSCNLYTKEFWQLAKERLNKNGICCQWVQAYGLPSDDFKHLLATFLSVYPDSLVCHSPGAGEIILLGFKDGPARIDLETLQHRIVGSYGSRYLLARAGVESTADLLARIKLDGKALAAKLSTVPEDALITDDRPSLEFAAAAGLALGEGTIKENINWILDKSSANPDIFKRLLRENLTIDLTVELARAFARIGLSYDIDMATELMSLVPTSIQPKPFIAWSNYLIDKSAGGNATKPVQPALSNDLKDKDLAALADQSIANQDFKKALELVSLMPKGQERSLRQAWIDIGQDRPLDARTELSTFEPTTSRRQLLALAKSYPLGDKKAIEYMKTVLELNPWDYQGHLLMTAMYCTAGDFDAGAAHVQDCLRLRALQPGNPGDSRPDPAALLLLSSCLEAHDSQGFMVHLWDLERSCPNNAFLRQLSQSPDPEQNLHTRVMRGLIERSNMEAIDNKYGYKMFESP